ncbi:MAG: flagellar FlbD family protein [Spirochaetes bacterium]|nr:flagellar FlbD family protein [Spirochaetota bacterium]
MIKVTRLNGVQYYLNANHIEYVEINPDTTLIMQSGKSYIIREGVDELLESIYDYHRRIAPPIIQE